MLLNLKCDGFGRSLLQDGAQDMEKRGGGGGMSSSIYQTPLLGKTN